MEKRPLSFRAFIIIYFTLIAWFIVASLLHFSGVVFNWFFAASLIFLEAVSFPILLLRKDKRHPFSTASDDEIRREDDVLLQGAAFSSAILFFYVNTLPEEFKALKVPFSLLIVFSIVPFYCFRAYAKIKGSPEYRILSSFVFVYLASNYVFQLLALFFPNFFPSVLTLHPLFQMLIIVGLSQFPLSLWALAIVYFPRRYGYVPRIRIIKEGRLPKFYIVNRLENPDNDCM